MKSINLENLEEKRRKKNEYERIYYRNNKDKIREYAIRYREKNIDKLRECCRKYQKKNRKRLNEYSREYYKKCKNEGREFKTSVVDMDRLIELLRENNGRMRKTDLGGICFFDKALKYSLECGLVEENDDEVWITDSPFKNALDGFFKEKENSLI